MKITKALLIFLMLVLNSCSSDDNNNSETPDDNNPTSKFAMTAKVDGELWEVNNPFNSNFATKPLFTYYPASEFIQLQGRKGIDEIVIYIKRTDLKVGTYPISAETNSEHKTQINFTYNTKENNQYVTEGSLSVTAVDLTAKTVKGTFSCKCVEDYSKPISADNPVTTTVTDGTFNYKYDVAY
jgi:hypothetical protein